MTQALAVHRDGEAFQSRLFWRKAIRLLQPETGIVRVGFESGPKGYDDIWAEYAPGRAPDDPRSNRILREHQQCKYHVVHGEYGHANLIDPDFINATSRSLLQRARAAQVKHAADGTGARFLLVTNWRPATSDFLSKLIRSRHGGLDLEVLFGTKTDSSAAGQVRRLWREHLGIDDGQLRLLAQTLGFSTISQTLDELRAELNELFPHVGLRPIPSNQATFPYDDILYQWLAQGRLEFDRVSFRDACKKQDLLAAAPKPYVSFGVKSFEHPIDRLEDRCTKVLNLVPQFDERAIRDDHDWSALLYPALHSFLLNAAKDSTHLRVAMDAHSTVAFAAGSILNVKSGREVEIEQRSGGYESWGPKDKDVDPGWPTWNFEVASPTDAGEDLVVAVGVTHDIKLKVLSFVTGALPNVTNLLIATPSSGPSTMAVVCGRHAFQLAESLAAKIRAVRKTSNRIHLFIAGPNAFTFFLGQRQPSLGALVLYEYDFEGARGGSYRASLTLPIKNK